MKRWASIALVAVYFVLSVGINVLIHSCGGNRSVDVLPTSTEDPCGCCEQSSGEMCCTSVLKTLQISGDQQAASGVSLTSPVCEVVDYPAVDDHAAFAVALASPSISSSPPPHVATTVLNCVFLI